MPLSNTKIFGQTTRWDAIIAEANRLASISTTYSQQNRYGPNSFDCSSSVSQLLRTAGYNVPWMTTDTLPNYLTPGKDPSGRITFWNKTTAEGGDQAHVWAEINGVPWGTNTQHPGHAVSYHNHTRSGFHPWHVTGLDQPHSIPNGADLALPIPGKTGQAFDTGGPNEGVGQGTGTGAVDTTANPSATAFSTYIEIPGLFDTEESLLLKGQKSLMNDQPLLPFIQQLTEASLRNFMSMPNGNFYAFFPDYFGGLNHKTPYWEIDDIEIIDGQINLSDDALATHVYVVGDLVGFDGVNITDKLQSGGVVTVFNAFQADFLNGIPETQLNQTSKEKKLAFDKSKPVSLRNKADAITFLQKYGARPYLEEVPMIRSPYYEAFLAYQKFCLMWARQFLTTFTFTFMPELYPGGIVSFPDHGIQCYIDEVVHTCSYTGGFTTQANLSAPAALKSGTSNNPVDARRTWVHAGMLRANLFEPPATKTKGSGAKKSTIPPKKK